MERRTLRRRRQAWREERDEAAAGWICDGEGWRAAAKGSGVRLVRATARSRAEGLARAIRSRIFFAG